MDDELHNFVMVWSLAIKAFCYCFYISARLPKGFFRLISLLPIFILFIILPLNLSSFHLCMTTAFFLPWLANFKLLLFSFDRGPLSPPPPNLFYFISIASLPVKPKQLGIQNHPNIKNDRAQKSSDFAKPNEIIPDLFAVKVLLLAILFHSYNYRQQLNENVILALYCVHTYLEVEIVLVLSAIPAAIFGFKIEQQFNEPYLATSLQEFWGNRWNLIVSSILRPTVYYPIRHISKRMVGARWHWLPAVIAVFVTSGLMHELLYYYVTRAYPTWEVTWFFIVQGVAVVIEVTVKKMVPMKWRLHRVVSGALVLGFVVVTAVWLFLPQLRRNRVDEKIIGEYLMLMDFMKDHVLPL